MKFVHKVQFLSSCISTFFFSFAYDIPAALNKSLTLNSLPLSQGQISGLYSAYALPNIIAPCLFYINGGVKSQSRLFSMIVFIGQFIFLSGIYFQSYNVLLLGRFVFGLGLETYSVIQNQLIAECTKKNMALISLYSSIVRLGTVFCFTMSKIGQEMFGTEACVVGSCVLVGLGHLLATFNEYYNKGLDNTKDNITDDENIAADIIIDSRNIGYNNLDITKQEASVSPCDLIESSVYKFSYKKLFKSSKTKLIKLYSRFTHNFGSNSNLFNIPFILIICICAMVSSVWAPFYNTAVLMFQKRYHATAKESSNLIALVEFTSLIYFLCLGSISKKTGCKLGFVISGSVILLGCHIAFLFNNINLTATCFILGLAGPMVGFYWACTIFLVNKENLGRSIAILNCVSNFSYTVMPIMAGKVMEKYGYIGVERVAVANCTVIFLLVGLLCLFNRRHGLGLNKSSSNN